MTVPSDMINRNGTPRRARVIRLILDRVPDAFILPEGGIAYSIWGVPRACAEPALMGETPASAPLATRPRRWFSTAVRRPHVPPRGAQRVPQPAEAEGLDPT
jgi:hypothetical protein